MRTLALVLICGVAMTACDAPPRTPTATPPTPATKPDNTGVNTRDRNDATKTPIDQNENQRDIDITAEIRKRVVDTEISVNAQNVKIITQDGKVTLRGPVNSVDEKNRIDQIAAEVAGLGNVDNQLEVQAQP